MFNVSPSNINDSNGISNSIISNNERSSRHILPTQIFIDKLEIGLLNIRSLHYKVAQLQSIICEESRNFNIFAINETCLDDTIQDHELCIPNYNIVRRDRRDKSGGGVAVYIKNTTPFIRHTEFETDEIEALWIEIILPHIKNVLLCVLYRPPESKVEWFDHFHDMMNIPSNSSFDIVIIGDFNINLLQETNKRWKQEIELYNLKQMVQVPTRETDLTSTLIDHVYTTNESRVVNVKVPHIRLSDHYPIYFTWQHVSNKSKYKKKGHQSVTYRATHKLNEDSFKHDLQNCCWQSVYDETDTNRSLEVWENIFLTIINKHAPQKKKRVKRMQQPNWFNADISHAIKMRDTTKVNDSPTYRFWRNKVVCLTRAAKQNYFKDSIVKNSGNSKVIWQILRNVQSNDTNMQSQQRTNLISDNGSVQTDPSDIANTFNSFFTSVSSKYISAIDNINVYDDYMLSVKEFVSSKLPEGVNFQIPEITNGFVFKSLMNLDTCKATGLDGISAYMLKLAAREITGSLTHILNNSIKTSVFPTQWKHAKVIPIYKNDSSLEVSNYRPISILPVLSKILERHVHGELNKFLNLHKLIGISQSGFREKHSCETALLKIIDDWMKSIDNGYLIGSVFLDLRKAFDLVNHSVLIDKLFIYGLSQSSLSWFKSYLMGRQQSTFAIGTMSAPLPITCGVPQGSIIGPLLFIIYMNDMVQCLRNCSADMYADDTTFYLKEKSTNVLNTKIEEDMDNVSKWCRNNKMVINGNKTKSMLVGSKQRLSSLPNAKLSIAIDGTPIQNVYCEKMLGVKIDNTLSWNDQIDYICKIITTRLALLRRIKPYIDNTVSILYYTGYILPILDYCSTVWGTCNATNLLRLYRLQKIGCTNHS